MVDRYPNYLSGRLTLSAANTLTTQSVQLPVVRPAGRRGSSTIIELLWVDWAPSEHDLVADGDNIQFFVAVGADPSSSLKLNSGRCLCEMRVATHFVTSGIMSLKFPMRYNFQDKLGFGQLIATETLWIGATSVGQAAATKNDYRIYYRFVTVEAEEYIGILQSQIYDSS